MLPDVALLEIFDFYEDEIRIEAWHTLVHVCRKWRSLVFGSPRRLKLRLHCTARTPVRETLDVWPVLPIVVRGNSHKLWGVDNIIAALDHNDRICELDLFDNPSSQLEKVLAAMQQPFPELIRLQLRPRDEAALIDPNSFLGGSAPRLQTLILYRVPFPGLPKLLLSATDLVYLHLWRIPYSGYITPEAVATCLSVLTRLESLLVKFESPRWRPDQDSRNPRLQARSLLPVLTELLFKGVGEYLEDLLARIDAPLLDCLDITLFHQLIFNTPQVTQFIGRAPKFKAHDEARVVFSDSGVWITLPQTFDGRLHLGTSCRQSDWQLSSLAQVCSSSFPETFIPSVERLYILENRFLGLHWQDDVEGSQWLELLHPFTSVKGLYISREFTPRFTSALQELVREGVTEVLPALQTLFFEELFPSGPVRETIQQFVAARQDTSHPIAVSLWKSEY